MATFMGMILLRRWPSLGRLRMSPVEVSGVLWPQRLRRELMRFVETQSRLTRRSPKPRKP